MAAETFTIGFVGAGAINFGRPEVPWCHAARLEKIGGFSVVGIADPDTKRSSEVLQERRAIPGAAGFYAQCKLLSNYQDLLQLKPDAVFIGIPPAFRGSLKEGRDVELQFVKAGVHVFVEKPLSVVPISEFRLYSSAVIQACKENNVVLSVGYMFRYTRFQYHITICMYTYYYKIQYII